MSLPLDHVTPQRLRHRKGVKWTTYGEDVLPAWIADMDFDAAPPVKQAIAEALERDDLGYPADARHRVLARAFTERMATRFGWQPDPRLVVPVGNLIQALIAAVGTFSQAGEGIVIQTPIYYPFLRIVESMGRTLVDNPLARGPAGYEPDIDNLRQAIDKNTRMLLFCNPHNPSGRVFTRSELEDIAQLAIEHDLTVVSDEVHADLVYPGSTHIPLASLGPEIAARTITITSATKAFNIAGLKCAVMHFGSRKLMEQQTAFFSPHMLGTPNTLGMEATLAAWQHGDEWLGDLLEQLDSNRQMIDDFLGQHLPQIGYHSPQATYLAWLDCSALQLPCRPHEFFLREAKVAFSDGGEFSSYTGDFVRLNFATSPQILQQILEATARSVSAG